MKGSETLRVAGRLKAACDRITAYLDGRRPRAARRRAA
jgi:hypothetical protein